jgi:hypothetical protein
MSNESSTNKNFLEEKLPYTWQLLASLGYGLEGSTGHRIRTAILLLHSKLLVKRIFFRTHEAFCLARRCDWSD